ncbi:TfoX/Sxy family protein [Paracoccus pacificus]|uniref:TfoX/Sxy family protein n=1 Tax=Paracoccus pacificus TaxID=1463598 RepID=A0ABW4R810_9RHOB
MARDAGLEEMMRADLGDLPNLREQAMFGGLCFMMNGNMVACIHKGTGLYRVGDAGMAQALAVPGTTQAMMGQRVMKGYVYLDVDHLDDDDTRAALTGIAIDFVRGLDPKE